MALLLPLTLSLNHPTNPPLMLPPLLLIPHNLEIILLMMKIMSLGIRVPHPLISSGSALSNFGITSIPPLYKSNPKPALPLANTKTTNNVLSSVLIKTKNMSRRISSVLLMASMQKSITLMLLHDFVGTTAILTRRWIIKGRKNTALNFSAMRSLPPHL